MPDRLAAMWFRIFALVVSCVQHFRYAFECNLVCGLSRTRRNSFDEALPEYIFGCTNHPDRCVCCKVSMTLFSYLKSVRVGEASNPGPWSSDPSRLKCCVINPTALVRKTDAIVGMKANLVFLSETSALTLYKNK